MGLYILNTIGLIILQISGGLFNLDSENFEPDKGHYILNPGSEIGIIIIICFIILCVLITIGLMIAIFNHRSKDIVYEKRVKGLKRRYDDALARLFSEEDLTKEKALAAFNEKDLNSDFSRRVLLREILVLHRNLSGKDAARVRDLYLWLGFKDDSYKKLRSSRWEIKAEGIKEIAQMRITEAYKEILEFVNDKHAPLRVEAQVALAKLIDFDALSFMDHSNYKLTAWEQMNLLHTFSNFQKDHVPDFSQWLEAKKESVVIYAIKMIGYFNQEQSIDKLIEFLDHKNTEIKVAAIQSLGKLEAFQAAEILKQKYPSESREVKIAILKALDDLGTDKDISFLEEQLKDQDRAISYEAAQTLAYLGETGPNRLNELMKNNNNTNDLKVTIKHALSNKPFKYYRYA